MTDQDRPMPLKDLPAYLNSVREGGQGGYAPVVDVGRIVDPGGSTVWFRRMGHAAAILLLLGAGVLAFGVAGTRNITISSDASDSRAVADIVREGGGNVFSVTKKDDGTYRVRVFTFRKMGQFLERLRENKEFDRVELEE